MNIFWWARLGWIAIQFPFFKTAKLSVVRVRLRGCNANKLCQNRFVDDLLACNANKFCQDRFVAYRCIFLLAIKARTTGRTAEFSRATLRHKGFAADQAEHLTPPAKHASLLRQPPTKRTTVKSYLHIRIIYPFILLLGSGPGPAPALGALAAAQPRPRQSAWGARAGRLRRHMAAGIANI